MIYIAFKCGIELCSFTCSIELVSKTLLLHRFLCLSIYYIITYTEKKRQETLMVELGVWGVRGRLVVGMLNGSYWIRIGLSKPRTGPDHF